MPELPEVETVKRSLQPILEGQRIDRIDVLYGGIIKNIAAEDFCRQAADRIIENIGRRGKYLLFNLSGGYTLVIHLRMTGQLIAAAGNEPLSKHTHLIFYLSGGAQLRFVDIRKFGLVFLVPTGEWDKAGGLCDLGPEPLEEEFAPAVFQELIKKKKGRLKAFLLDQRNIAGIGNIYADEIMFAAGLHPERRVETLKPDEIDKLYAAIKAKLEEGVESRGTSIRDYVDGRGEKGGFQEKLQVYDRGGQICVRCGTSLVKSVIAGRGSVFCPHCQR